MWDVVLWRVRIVPLSVLDTLHNRLYVSVLLYPQMHFGTFQVPKLFLQMGAVLALYTSGRTTGCVLDSGDGYPPF